MIYKFQNIFKGVVIQVVVENIYNNDHDNVVDDFGDFGVLKRFNGWTFV